MRLTTLELHEDEGKPAEVHWVGAAPTVETLDRLIAVLGHMRADTPPAVPTKIELFTKQELVREIGLHVGKAVDGKPMFSVRHPGFGWLSYRLDEKAKQFLLKELQQL